ncbi:MAG: DUF4326 domain-containing protein [Deltaproteobacteria bacterium]|nr:DUF4326 domain-containing protein [Deltaproteobacteria bacterium]
MPEGAPYASRPTKWGNQFKGAPSIADYLYREDFHTRLQLRRIDFSPLHGKDLACWCPLDKPCHAGVPIEAVERVELAA